LTFKFLPLFKVDNIPLSVYEILRKFLLGFQGRLVNTALGFLMSETHEVFWRHLDYGNMRYPSHSAIFFCELKHAIVVVGYHALDALRYNVTYLEGVCAKMTVMSSTDKDWSLNLLGNFFRKRLSHDFCAFLMEIICAVYYRTFDQRRVLHHETELTCLMALIAFVNTSDTTLAGYRLKLWSIIFLLRSSCTSATTVVYLDSH